MTRCRTARFSRRGNRLPPTERQRRKPMTSAAATSRDPSEALFATPSVVADRRADGSIVLKSTELLRESARCVGDWLEHWARQTPDRIFLGDRAGVDAPWQTITHKDALKQVRAAAISPAYSLMSRDFDKLRSMITLLGPGAIYVSGTTPFAPALAAIAPL